MTTNPSIIMTAKLMPALILDLDGTVRRTKSGGDFIKGIADIEIFPEMKRILPRYRELGWLVIGVSNQGGVAYGFKTPDQINEELKATAELFLPRHCFHLIKACLHMPGGTVFPYNVKSLMRKPYYGMLAYIEMQLFQYEQIQIDWDKSLFVGDREEDKLCAEAAEIKFEWAHEFRNRPHVFEIPVGKPDTDPSKLN